MVVIHLLYKIMQVALPRGAYVSCPSSGLALRKYVNSVGRNGQAEEGSVDTLTGQVKSWKLDKVGGLISRGPMGMLAGQSIC